MMIIARLLNMNSRDETVVTSVNAPITDRPVQSSGDGGVSCSGAVSSRVCATAAVD